MKTGYLRNRPLTAAAFAVAAVLFFLTHEADAASADRAAIEREYREQVFVPCVVMIVVSSGGGTPAEVMAGRFFRNLNRTVQPEVDGIVDTVLAGYRNDPAGRQALYNELLADCIRDLIEDGQG